MCGWMYFKLITGENEHDPLELKSQNKTSEFPFPLKKAGESGNTLYKTQNVQKVTLKR